MRTGLDEDSRGFGRAVGARVGHGIVGIVVEQRDALDHARAIQARKSAGQIHVKNAGVTDRDKYQHVLKHQRASTSASREDRIKHQLGTAHVTRVLRHALRLVCRGSDGARSPVDLQP